MSNSGLNRRISEALNRFDKKMAAAKLDGAIEMLQKGNPTEITKKLNKHDQNELIDKLNEIDKSAFQDLNIDLHAISKKITDDDFEKIRCLFGLNGDAVVNKLKEILD
jgi:hypothetical protein